MYTLCVALMPDIQVRSDAYDRARIVLLDASVDGVYMVGGDQTVTMEVLRMALAGGACGWVQRQMAI